MTNVAYSRNGKTYEIDTETLKPESIEYLLQYGFAQSLQDSIAGREKKVGEELFSEYLKANNGRTPAENEEQSEYNEKKAAAIASDLDGALMKRLDAIVAGTIGVRSIGEARDVLKSVANGMIRKALARKKAKVSKEKFAELVADLLAKDRTKVQAEYDRQCAEAEALDVDIEL